MKPHLEHTDKKGPEKKSASKKRNKKASLNKARLEEDGLQIDGLKKDGVEINSLEKESLEKESLEKESLGKESLGIESIKKDNLEEDSLKKDNREEKKLNSSRLVNEKLEDEKLEDESLEGKRLEEKSLEEESLEEETLKEESLEEKSLEVKSLDEINLQVENSTDEEMEKSSIESKPIRDKISGFKNILSSCKKHTNNIASNLRMQLAKGVKQVNKFLSGKQNKVSQDANLNSVEESSELLEHKFRKILVHKVKEIYIKISDQFKRIPRNGFISPLLFFVGLILYLEVVFHLIVFRSLDSKIIYPIFFALPLGALYAFLTGIFNKLVNKIIMWLVTVITCLLFCLQFVYFSVFKVFFSFQSMGMAGDAISEFGADVTNAIKTNVLGMVLLLLPIPILAFLIHKAFHCERRKRKEQGIIFAGVFVMQLFALITLLFFGKGDFTPYDLYHKSKVPDLCGKQLGVVTLIRFDLAELIKGEEELVLADTSAISWDVVVEPTTAPTMTPAPEPQVTIITEEKEVNALPTPSPLPTPTPIDTSPNILNIDFNALAEKEKDDTIQTLHNYFASVTPTNKNEYTGMFKGYNLIMITAEGFSPYAVHEEMTPTLYKLTREGMVFNNFYTALWQTSTSDGEYVAMTGLIPIGTRSMYHSRNNLMPFALGHQFNRLGIESKAYHNHTYTYYQRNETHPNLGYIFTAKGNGLVLESDVWPGSDLEMINHTVDEFTDEEQFHIYYLTVSGHMNYTFVGNSMAYKNRELVKDLPYSSDAKAYIACQIELDRALEQLIKKLEEAGVADKTVIALSADHYPYGWEKEKLDELAGHEVEPNFEVFKNHFILWNPAMEENIIVEEPASSLDILPTLSNLFGLEYDSRLLMGQDIFSDAEPLVILNNRSFITDKVMYNSETGDAIYLTEEELPEDYITNLNKIIKNKFTVSQGIIKKDYYRYVFPDYPNGFGKGNSE